MRNLSYMQKHNLIYLVWIKVRNLYCRTSTETLGSSQDPFRSTLDKHSIYIEFISREATTLNVVGSSKEISLESDEILLEYAFLGSLIFTSLNLKIQTSYQKFSQNQQNLLLHHLIWPKMNFNGFYLIFSEFCVIFL